MEDKVAEDGPSNNRRDMNQSHLIKKFENMKLEPTPPPAQEIPFSWELGLVDDRAPGRDKLRITQNNGLEYFNETNHPSDSVPGRSISTAVCDYRNLSQNCTALYPSQSLKPDREIALPNLAAGSVPFDDSSESSNNVQLPNYPKPYCSRSTLAKMASLSEKSSEHESISITSKNSLPVALAASTNQTRCDNTNAKPWYRIRDRMPPFVFHPCNLESSAIDVSSMGTFKPMHKIALGSCTPPGSNIDSLQKAPVRILSAPNRDLPAPEGYGKKKSRLNWSAASTQPTPQFLFEPLASRAKLSPPSAGTPPNGNCIVESTSSESQMLVDVTSLEEWDMVEEFEGYEQDEQDWEAVKKLNIESK